MLERNDIAALDRQARELRADLTGAFEAGDAAAARLESHAVRVSRVMGEWSRETGVLRSRFQALSDTAGHAFAIAMTPAVEAMNRFMAAALRAARSFRSFLYSLFGKKYNDTLSGAAEAWDGLGDSASGAGRRVSAAAREIRRSLMAFDEINRLDWEPESSGSGSSGGGSGSGGDLDLDGGWDELIPPDPFGELLRSLIDDSRFREAGQALAGKLGEIVDGLDEALTSGSFRERLSEKLSALTEGVNGFFAGLTFTEGDKRSVAGRIGDFLGDAVGLGLESAHAVLSGLDWPAVGTSIAQFVNGAVASLREKDANLGTVLADWLNAQLGTLDGLFSELDWADAGTYVAENVNAWFENVDWEQVGRTVRDGVLGLKDFVTTALSELDIDWKAVWSAFITGLTGTEHPGAVLSFTADLVGWKDSLKNKWVGFGADLTKWWDDLTGGRWLTGFGADLTKWWDDLTGGRWLTGFGADLTKWWDDLTGGRWITGFGADLTKWWDDLTGGRWITGFGADLTKWWNSLTKDEYGVYGWLGSFGVGITNWWNSMTKDKYGVYGWLGSFGVTFTNWWNGMSKDGWGVYGWLSGFGASITKWWNAVTNTLVSFKAGGGVFAGGRWHDIAAYASGGSPDGGQLFLAREAGPELVGTLGGHTAVMNNDQIVASVSAGVARAIAGIKFYSRERYTPALAVIGRSAARSEEHLAALSARAGGGAVPSEVPDLLRQILAAVKAIDPDVTLDGESVKDRVVALVNANTRATGVCEILV